MMTWVETAVHFVEMSANDQMLAVRLISCRNTSELANQLVESVMGVLLSCSRCMQFIELVLSHVSLQENFLNWRLGVHAFMVSWSELELFTLLLFGVQWFCSPLPVERCSEMEFVQTCSSTSHLNVTFVYVGVHAVLNGWVK
ncbi:uncharacterized protein LOC124190230 [Daphnia pulex]|uniref:uncharacterized protein LOC124190230 n=1 Tax=Daphnia pulex TaxID=6669 RepID=UPI001EDF251A|nr:uncharacterized protein LOC124190230 [Daphnia pulex]XP_046438765.1 uncharacterized protein LOC124190230 [Daphnia pulex]